MTNKLSILEAKKDNRDFIVEWNDVILVNLITYGLEIIILLKFTRPQEKELLIF